MSSAREVAGQELAELCVRLFGARQSDEAKLIAFAEERARARSMDLRAYVSALRTDDSEQARLARVATNGWTWFWREAATLIAACENLARRPRHRVQAWVAGCSTGEEAYTLAIVAERAGINISILATDIDECRVDHARTGRYQESALRHLPPELTARYFVSNGNLWRPVPSLGSRIRFEVHNLLSRPPTPPAGDWDLVSCRNVMLHADAASARRMLANLCSVLDPFGERVLSAADELAVDASRLARGPSPTLPPPPPAVRPATTPRPPAGIEDEGPPPAHGQREGPSFEALLTLGNRHLGNHRLDDAALAYEAAGAVDPHSAELAIMQGILHRKTGRLREAEDVIRRALFLEPDLWLGWMLLAGIYERAGLPQRARRALETTLQALDRRPRLKWRAPECGITDRHIDPATARRFCRTRLSSERLSSERLSSERLSSERLSSERLSSDMEPKGIG